MCRKSVVERAWEDLDEFLVKEPSGLADHPQLVNGSHQIRADHITIAEQEAARAALSAYQSQIEFARRRIFQGFPTALGASEG